jgi:hypothetical protein
MGGVTPLSVAWYTLSFPCAVRGGEATAPLSKGNAPTLANPASIVINAAPASVKTILLFDIRFSLKPLKTI